MSGYLVWSNQHRMWWRANHSGYTEFIEEAGRYSRADAEKIVTSATLAGQLDEPQQDPVTGLRYARSSEVMVLAPEDIDQGEVAAR